ncbi:MAG: hypothetical protein WCG25_05135 [bacterium]
MITLHISSCQSIDSLAFVASSGFLNSTKPNPLLLPSSPNLTLANTTSQNFENSSLSSRPLIFRFNQPTNNFVSLIT